ncbi:MAG: methyltransferase domain-containing protein, partial [Rhodospirillales bacterium]
MWIDVVDLRDIYSAPLGQAARRMIRRKMRAMWPDMKGQRILGIGYAAPYLEGFRDEADRVIAAMPARQGVLRWPAQGGGEAALVYELELTFPDLSMDRIVLVHALECAEQVEPLMREIWRVLTDSGRLMVVVPNRSGLWARFERTPFGHGRPFSPRQLTRLLRESMFTPLTTDRALYMPPFRTALLVRSATAWERAGAVLWGSFAGVVVMEAVKQIYAATPAHPARGRRTYLAMPERRGAAAGRVPLKPGPG